MASIEQRMKVLEEEVARIKARLAESPNSQQPWWEKIWGTFANDPAYEEAMRLGREYRESLRPKPARRKKRKNGRT